MITKALTILVFLLALVLTAATVLAQNAPPAAYDDMAAYAVYSAIVETEWPARVAHAKRLVIQIETTDYPKFAPSDKTCLIPSKSEEAIYRPVITAYEEINKKTWLLQPRFSLTVPYELVSKASVLSFFDKKGVDGWKDFNAKYPDSGGFIIMSAVGFNADKTLAVVYLGHSCGGLCGGGMYRVLQKIEGKWSEIRWNGETCVWAS